MKFKCDGVVEITFLEPRDGKPVVNVNCGENSWEVYGEGYVDQSRGIILMNYQITREIQNDNS
jgi:hypothetical protein